MNVAREGTVDLRWKRIMEENGNGKIGQGKLEGEISPDQDPTQPTDSQFKTHFEDLLIPVTEEEGEINSGQAPSIPILDNSFTFTEKETTQRGKNERKSFVGIGPALVAILPMIWLMFVHSLFNIFFESFYFPLALCYSKLTVLSKSDECMLCDNSRLISIMHSQAKLYDTLIIKT